MDTTSDPTTPVLFISHAAMDKEIALFLKDELEHIFSLDAFASSDPEDLPVGDPWVERILDALDRAKLVVVLATERGLSRKWVWFEAGAGWDRRRKIVTCCVGKVRRSELPPPFSLHTAVNIDEVEDLCTFLNLITAEFGASAGKMDCALLTREIARRDIRAEERQKLAIIEDEQRPFTDYRVEVVKKKLDEIQAGGRGLLRFVMAYGEIDNGRIYKAWRRGYEPYHTVTAVCESGLVQKRSDRVNNIEVGWYLRANPDLEPLLKKLLFPINEQETSPYFQV